MRTTQQYHLAQINVAQAKAEMDSDQMSGFVTRLDEINAIADATPGFIWRLQGDDGDASSIRVFEDALQLINISVWQDVKSLKRFIYHSMHKELLRDKDSWFNKLSKVHHALWWVPEGHTPSTEEAVLKLQDLENNGPNQQVFNFSKVFEAW